MHGFGVGNSSPSFAPSEGKDVGFGGPAGGARAKAEGTGQFSCLCPSGGLGVMPYPSDGQKRWGGCVPVWLVWKDDTLKSALAVALSDPHVLLRCLLLCSSGQPALRASVAGK